MKPTSTVLTAIGLGLCLGASASCGGGSTASASTGVATEYVTGVKRYAGPYKRKAAPSRKADHELGVPDRKIEIKAAIAGFEPDHITVKKGEVVEINLIGVDNGKLPALTGVKRFTGHGFHVYAYDIWVNGLRAGVERTIKFEASKAGTFPFECVVFCSPDHYKMNGRMIVEP